MKGQNVSNNILFYEIYISVVVKDNDNIVYRSFALLTFEKSYDNFMEKQKKWKYN